MTITNIYRYRLYQTPNWNFLDIFPIQLCFSLLKFNRHPIKYSWQRSISISKNVDAHFEITLLFCKSTVFSNLDVVFVWIFIFRENELKKKQNPCNFFLSSIWTYLSIRNVSFVNQMCFTSIAKKKMLFIDWNSKNKCRDEMQNKNVIFCEIFHDSPLIGCCILQIFFFMLTYAIIQCYATKSF